MMIMRYQETRRGVETICDLDDKLTWHLVKGNDVVAEVLNLAMGLRKLTDYWPLGVDIDLLLQDWRRALPGTVTNLVEFEPHPEEDGAIY